MRRLIIVVLLSASVARASFCGDSMIPYSLEVLADGQPVLGCARPTCFGWAPSGRPHSEQAAFYSVHGSVDGFTRQERASIPPSDARPTQYARCSPTFAATGCPEVDSWVGGGAPLLNLTAYPTSLRCCTYDPLRQSEDRGVATVGGGQIVVGGEVLANGVQYAFDYVADIGKQVAMDGSFFYAVAIRRFLCPPLDSNQYAKKDEHANTSFLSRAFQDPNVAVNQPLPPPQQGQGIAQNAVVEEIVQTEGIQFPPGTNFQPVPPPTFAQPPPPVAPAQSYYYPMTSYGYGYQQQLCFSGDMLVELADGSTKRMDELEKEDLVRVGTTYSEFLPVKFWLHREPKQEAEFYRFETEDQHSIKLTALHYIYMLMLLFHGDCSIGHKEFDEHSSGAEIVLAESINEGDCLFTVGNDGRMRESRVTGVTRVVETGIYAPMTAAGRIVVNGVLASCHATVNNHHIQKTFFTFVDALKSLFGGVETGTTELPLGLNMLRETFTSVTSKDAFAL